MDRLIKRFDAVIDGDLALCEHRGVAYQRDMKVTAKYDAAYYDKCKGYEGQEIAQSINAGRVALVARHHEGRVLDIGVGSGEFIGQRPDTWGYDVNPVAVEWLKETGHWSDKFREFNALTMWDVIEHVPAPETYLKRVPIGGWVFVSIPVFEDLKNIRASRHYRPGEHLYYWTERGFVEWMALYNFALVERATFETDAGRDSIVSFAFQRSLPGHDETVVQYSQVHASKYYGASSSLYLDLVVPEISKLKPRSVLDYGCGRSDLVAHLYLDGRRTLARYDPAIPAYQTMPEGRFDVVLCNDVMEHILMTDVDQVLAEIRAKSQRALFTISLKPARQRLPDGRNAHVTLLTRTEWIGWLAEYFGVVVEIPTQWDHILMVRTWDD